MSSSNSNFVKLTTANEEPDIFIDKSNGNYVTTAVNQQSPYWTVSGSSWSSINQPIFHGGLMGTFNDNPSNGMFVKKTLELETVSGAKTILTFSWSEIKTIFEKDVITTQWNWKFPFIHRNKSRATFINFNNGDSYIANCRLSALTTLFDLEYTSYAQLMLKGMATNGE